jgi:altronate dehydratase
MPHAFRDIARLPLPGDNVAIATQRLEAGAVVETESGGMVTLSHAVLEGHRFAVEQIAPGDYLLSWELPFGHALTAIAPGDYVCNQSVLDTLAIRSLDFNLPAEPNFEDGIPRFELDAANFQPGQQVDLRDDPPVFEGYDRGARGVGTRNFIIILATSSRTAGYAHLLAERLQGAAAGNIDGIVAVTHTEGGTHETPNNADLLLRTLAGFVTHPNVGAVLAVDYGRESITNHALQDYLVARRYPIDDMRHHFLSLEEDLSSGLEAGERILRGWLEPVGRMARSAQPLTKLKIALQCGGSDAFSGISGNPLAAWAARELIRCGGSAVLAETDELWGAESYVLNNVRNLETAQAFLAMMEGFEKHVAAHGSSFEGNPSGGNKYRGLYNIALKSLGAATKRHPDVRLDYAIDYAQPLTQPGYYFMHSPGNDLESIAGEVAAGCNLVYFVTGNGSITNFPFVPTIKIITTTRRYELLRADMDVNAGAYFDGEPMDRLGHDLFERTINVASGKRTRGEHAGHSQVSIWRNWQQRDGSRLAEILAAKQPDGEPIPIKVPDDIPDVSIKAIRSGDGYVTDRIGLILPTSLCAGQIARMGAERLNAAGLGRAQGLSRFASLVHTEGCGMSGFALENIYNRTLLGYLVHPLVESALLLEHGCEKTHNDFMRNELEEQGIPVDRFGWASVQLDGGIDKVLGRIEDWARGGVAKLLPVEYEVTGLDALRIGLFSAGPVTPGVAASLARLAGWIVGAGGTVVVPENDALHQSRTYLDALLGGVPPRAGVAMAQRFGKSGYHIMATATQDSTEIATALGATGVDILLAHGAEHPLQGNPIVALLQITEGESRFGDNMDLVLAGDPQAWPDQLLDLLVRTASRETVAKADALGNTGFQISRGLLGVST